MSLHLGEFEQIVLMAMMQLGDDAYGVTIAREIERRTGRGASVDGRPLHDAGSHGSQGARARLPWQPHTDPWRPRKEVLDPDPRGRQGAGAIVVGAAENGRRA